MIPRRFALAVIALATLSILYLYPQATSASSRMPLQGRLVAAYTGTPLVGAEVVVWSGRQICVAPKVRAGSGECVVGPRVCRQTIPDLAVALEHSALEAELGLTEVCPAGSLAEIVSDPFTRATTDDGGWFRSEQPLWSGRYTVLLLAPGRLPRDLEVEMPNDLMNQWPLYPDSCRLSGTVRDEAGRPLAGVQVTVAPLDKAKLELPEERFEVDGIANPVGRIYWGHTAEVVSGTDGRYCVPWLYGDRYFVTALPPAGRVDYPMQRLIDSSKRRQAVVEIPGEKIFQAPVAVSRDLVVSIASGARVQGRVLDRESGVAMFAIVSLNRVVDTRTMQPVRAASRLEKAARLTARAAGMSAADEEHWMVSVDGQAVAQTDRDGKYAIEGAGPGVWQLTARPRYPLLPSSERPLRDYLMASRYVTIGEDTGPIDIWDIRIRGVAIEVASRLVGPDRPPGGRRVVAPSTDVGRAAAPTGSEPAEAPPSSPAASQPSAPEPASGAAATVTRAAPSSSPAGIAAIRGNFQPQPLGGCMAEMFPPWEDPPSVALPPGTVCGKPNVWLRSSFELVKPDARVLAKKTFGEWDSLQDFNEQQGQWAEDGELASLVEAYLYEGVRDTVKEALKSVAGLFVPLPTTGVAKIAASAAFSLLRNALIQWVLDGVAGPAPGLLAQFTDWSIVKGYVWTADVCQPEGCSAEGSCERWKMGLYTPTEVGFVWQAVRLAGQVRVAGGAPGGAGRDENQYRAIERTARDPGLQGLVHDG
ncbi:MAG: hypothetical protein HYV63_28885 [Candidatus Schekmanbacteria bacterium]|nr:hypothetical protein [Candidatus Schekmanbacteria bacterium]